MGIHLYLLSANPPTLVIVSHDLTDLYYQPMYSAKIRILKKIFISEMSVWWKQKKLLSVLIFTMCFKYWLSNFQCQLGLSSSNVFLILLITGDLQM